MTSYCTDWFIGILTMASRNEWVYSISSRIQYSLYTPKKNSVSCMLLNWNFPYQGLPQIIDAEQGQQEGSRCCEPSTWRMENIHVDRKSPFRIGFAGPLPNGLSLHVFFKWIRDLVSRIQHPGRPSSKPPSLVNLPRPDVPPHRDK